jgi:Spy/CpxP family protein refolding chaperone
VRLLRKLGLSADQKAQVQGILADAQAARQKNAAERQAARAQMAALANPGDPNYAAALETAKTRAAEAIQKRSDLQVSLYNVLTPQQKAQLTQLIAERRAQRAASLQGRHSGTAAST